MRVLLAILALLFMLTGCQSVHSHREAVRDDTGDRMTVGVVQKEIRKGMSQADVATALGSPNIVTRDSTGKEAWIYDKISTEVAYSKSSGGVDAMIIGGGIVGNGIIGGGGGAGYSSSTGASSTSQRTLTVVIKFAEGVVDEYSYHSSRF
ncbi:hypothetical protein [Salidesulfovibrio onnuriiensis]|uniref:hypothetical protein n=1 Tax=Salidesulfovibrio onnuriiensis TaxID=2583823 RepID=UPI0011C7F50F|nr:hypothetical protein [Salidesulfovibrio onnuriiensis]